MHCPKDKNHSPFHGEQQPAIYTENQQVAVFLTKFTTLWTTTL